MHQHQVSHAVGSKTLDPQCDIASVATPLADKELPGSFKERVALLQRPYTAISEQQFHKLRALARRKNTDIVIFEGRQATFGTADGGFAIMPLARTL